jgi:hypothetical protein
MSEMKTQKNDADVIVFLNGIEDEQRRKDSFLVLEMMKELTGKEPKMWGDSIIGFDTYHYRYASGREGDWMKVGFSPRKQALTLYLSYGFEEKQDLLQRLGKHKTGKACLYIKKMEDVDTDVLRELIEQTLAEYDQPSQ